MSQLDEPYPMRLTTADGVALEAEATVPADPRAAVLLAHPHPRHGGSMRSLVTSELFRALPGLRCAVVRFNFRGVEGSEGRHGGGRDERHDVVAGLDALVEQAPGVPAVAAGWSFGADVSLSVTDPRLAGWFAVAPPLRILGPTEYLAGADPRPKLLAVPERDEFNPPEPCRAAVAGWRSTEVRVVPGADHFLVGRTQLLADLLAGFVDGLASPA
jgi:alpha/beta superfamily hydrolase